jgi:hypothetical protein
MEKTNQTQAERSRELLLKLLDAVNGKEEYRYLQEQLALVRAALVGSFLNNEKEVQTIWQMQ